MIKAISILMLVFTSNAFVTAKIEDGAILLTRFNYQRPNTQEYKMSFKTLFKIGDGSRHPTTVGHDFSVRHDTLFVKIYYDVSGTWLEETSITTDTLAYIDTLHNFSYINSSTNRLYTYSDDTARTDTTRNITDSTFDLRPTDVAQNQSLRQFRLFPNPASGIVTIDLPGILYDLDVTCSDLFGKRMRELHFDGIQQNGLLIDVTDLPPGMYTIDVFSRRKRQATQKFMKVD